MLTDRLNLQMIQLLKFQMMRHRFKKFFILKKNKTTSIIITHDMACAKVTGDRLVILRDGVIGAEGSYNELEKSEDEWVRSFFI